MVGWGVCKVKGESIKTSLNLQRSFGLISLPTNMLVGWDIFHLKGGIYSSVWCTKTFLYDIRELRYKQIKMGYQISKIFNIGQSSVLKSAVPYCFIYISAPLCFTDMGFNFEACLRM